MSVTCIRSHVGLHVSKTRLNAASFPFSKTRKSSVTKVLERSLNLVPSSSSLHFIETTSEKIKHRAVMATRLWSESKVAIWRNKSKMKLNLRSIYHVKSLKSFLSCLFKECFWCLGSLMAEKLEIWVSSESNIYQNLLNRQINLLSLLLFNFSPSIYYRALLSANVMWGSAIGNMAPRLGEIKQKKSQRGWGMNN